MLDFREVGDGLAGLLDAGLHGLHVLVGHLGDAGIRLQLNMRQGYDHSYYFISTFRADHLRWHSERLA